MDASKLDMGRPDFETEVCVIYRVFHTIGSCSTLPRIELVHAIACAKDAYDNVDRWAQTENAPFHFASSSMRPKVRKEPKGTVLVIVPFNLPVLLAMQPVVREDYE